MKIIGNLESHGYCNGGGCLIVQHIIFIASCPRNEYEQTPVNYREVDGLMPMAMQCVGGGRLELSFNINNN